MNPVFIKEYEVSTFLVNSHKRLGLVGLLNILQDAAGLHAQALGLGHEKMTRDQKFWVLTRQGLHMDRWPRWREEITIKTWPRPLEGMAAVRDFEVFVGQERLGHCVSTWMVLDAATRRPTRPNLENTTYPESHTLSLNIEPEKVVLPNSPQLIDQLRVRSSDLDMNKHVNNTKYAEWILNAIDYRLHTNHVIGEYQINFLAETHLGDEIEIEAEEHIFQGRRKSDAKIVFRAKITPRELPSQFV